MNMENMPTFLNIERMSEFWFYIKWLLYVGMPFIMIYAALQVSDKVAHGILDIFKKRKDKRDQDDDGYDVYRY